MSFFALPLAALCFVGLGALDRRRGRRALELLGPRCRSLGVGESSGRSLRRRLLLSGAVGLAFLAAAEERWGRGEEDLEPPSAAVVIALDVSRSMLARDAGRSRLERAKREIRDLAATTTGLRLALVAFAGDAKLLVPLTRDAVSYSALLDLADPTVALRGGTDLGAALDAARAAFHLSSRRPRTIVLLTDGEDLGANGLAAAERARDAGIVVHAVGLGTRRGSKIVLEGDTYLRDASGREVVSALDAEGLARIAERTGGTYVDVDDAPRALVGLAEKGRPSPSPVRLPLGGAFLLFAAAIGMGRMPAVAGLALGLLLLPACGRAREGPDAGEAMRATFLRGNAAYARSIEAAERAAETPEDLRAWMPAMVFAEDALAAWQTAAASRADWPEARRNVERGLLWLRTLRESRGGRPKEAPKEEPEAKGEDEPPSPKDEDAALDLETGDLPASQVLGLLETLDAKEGEKRALRQRRLGTRSSRDGRDW